MDNQKNLDEKLSELFDGELDPFEIQNVLESISESKDLQKKTFTLRSYKHCIKSRKYYRSPWWT